MGKLTAIGVRNAIQPGKYADGQGLFLHVRPGGSRQWYLRIQKDGKRRDISLGNAHEVSLADARVKASQVRSDIANGMDPVIERQKAKQARLTIPTFEAAARRFHSEMQAGWRNDRHRGDWISTLERHVFPSIGDTRIDLIDATAIRETLLPIWLSKPETARRVRQRIRAVFDWAVIMKFRDSLDLSGLGNSLPKQPRSDNHFAAMPWAEIPAFVAQMRELPESVGRLALLFTMLTAARSGEVRGATWSEIDFENRLWTIPAGRMKANKEHVVPLSDAAIEVLAIMTKLRTSQHGFLFPSVRGKALSDMTLTKVLRDQGQTCTVHGFRSSFKDWCSEATAFPDAVSEAALAHTDRNKVRAAYRRTNFLDQRRDLMEAWAQFVGGRSNVVVGLPSRTRLSA